jgi:hypothetical protein
MTGISTSRCHLSPRRRLSDSGAGTYERKRGCVRKKKKPQISPLRYAPVEMTNLLH